MLEEKRDPSGVLYIYDRVLEKGSHDRRWVKMLVAPNLQTMQEDCFYACPHLEKVVAPNLKKIESGCFEACPKLTSFIAPFLKLQNVHFLGSLFIDLNKKEILSSGILEPRLVRAIEKEIQNEAPLSIQEKEAGVQVLKSGAFEILKVENGVITGICLPTAKVFPSHSLYENKGVKELVLPLVEKLDHNSVYKAQALEKVIAPCLKHVRFSNFSKCPRLECVEAPKLFVLEHSCFNENESLKNLHFDALESVDRNCFCHLPQVEEVYFPQVTAIGESSLQYNQNMKQVILPELIELERGILYRSSVQNLYAPKIHNRSTFIKYLKNARTLIKNKAVLPLNYKNRIKDERQNV
ncbi:MAG: leucine-rich repeat protein [Alphaproteobacteria bacterium]|nr:leucine-rich repeat protein [Alphaproteobacteria bacterium]